jgi:general secretion pathway protein G
MQTQRTRRQPKGFTLIEIMIVLAIVGLLFSFVGVNAIQKFRESKVQGAKIQMGAYKQALEALIRKPTVGKIPENYPAAGYLVKKELAKDPFGNPYRYECEDYQNYTLSSDGPDGEPGTDDDIRAD